MQSMTWAGLLLLVLQWLGPELTKMLAFWREEKAKDNEGRRPRPQ